MKVGDLVIMPGSNYSDVGVIVADSTDHSDVDMSKSARVGVMWADGDGAIDWEPKKWLKVSRESGRNES